MNVKLFNGKVNDAKILNIQLNETYLINSTLHDQNKDIFLADKGYDSSIVRESLLNKKYKRIIIPQNKRNIKNKELLVKLNKREKKIFNKRTSIERLFARMKSYKRINVRYDKYSESYMGFVHLACIIEFIRR